MGRAKGWMQEQTGRPAMHSPGRPAVNQRLAKQAFWERIAAGLQSEDAARACGISQPLGPRWFREAGGVPPTNLGLTSARYLSFSEREEIALVGVRSRLMSMHRICILVHMSFVKRRTARLLPSTVPETNRARSRLQEAARKTHRAIQRPLAREARRSRSPLHH